MLPNQKPKKGFGRSEEGESAPRRLAREALEHITRAFSYVEDSPGFYRYKGPSSPSTSLVAAPPSLPESDDT